MEQELALDPGPTPAAYWLAAGGARHGRSGAGLGAAAMAAGSRALLARDRGAALRADLDRLMTQAIIPERAARLQVAIPSRPPSGMLAEWEAFKANWSQANGSALRFLPVLANPDIHRQRHVQLSPPLP